jgi:carbamate kinase
VTARPAPSAPRVVVALGGNAIAAPDRTDAPAQQEAVERAMEDVAAIVARGYEVALTHGNGPQVGNLLVKNELASGVVPPVPLDWCVAQTQATLGYLMVSALEDSLRRRGLERTVAALVSRVLVDADDPEWTAPSKPIGAYRPEREARRRMTAGQHWEPRGERGWRRLAPSPQPRALLDREAVQRLMEGGAVVVAAGGGGIPMLRRDGRLVGVEAVVDKDLSAALLAEAVDADQLIIATDVDGVAVGFGTAAERWLRRVTPSELRRLDAEGHFSHGSMRPKVEACARFLERGGRRAIVTSLDRLVDALEERAGTLVERDRAAA